VLPADYPRSLERDLVAARARAAAEPRRVVTQLMLADVCRNLADDLLTEPAARRNAYDEGANAAARALALDETSAEAHFLYAVNRGSAARLGSVLAGNAAVRDVKYHVARAIALRADYAEALAFMGGLLAELPWPLGGTREEARGYLERAVAIDGNFTGARLALARLYMRDKRVDAARHELRAVVEAERPHYPYTWAMRFQPEARQLLDRLDRDHPPGR